MNENMILLIYCGIFSFLCAISKQLFDMSNKKINKLQFISGILLSTVIGLTLSFLLFNVLDKLMLIGISGIGGTLGLSALYSISKLMLGQASIQIKLIDDDNIVDSDSINSFVEDKKNKHS